MRTRSFFPPGFPAGSFEDRGTVTLLDRELPLHVLVFEGKDKLVYCGDRFEDLEFYILLDDDPGPESGMDYTDLQVPADLQAEFNRILGSFERVSTR